MKTKGWVAGWFCIVVIMLTVIGKFVYHIDPYFHYHEPDTTGYYYTLNNQRSQNDGISKHFSYNALITGTSMTENFKTSELDEIFGVNSIKVPYSGGSYKEINDNLKIALAHNPDLGLIVRGLDTGRFLDAADVMRTDLGIYPAYLYDENPFNDVKYLFNKDVIFSRAYAMAQANDEENFVPGITSFDEYARWQYRYTFGIKTLSPDGIKVNPPGKPVHLTDELREIIKENITQNVTSLADEYPEVEFYYFFTPYSALWYQSLVDNGRIYRQIEAERYIIELILAHENIKLFSFNGIGDITTDINNYKDLLHYGIWVNSYMLECMRDNKYRLTKDNYQQYLEEELELYVHFDYGSLNRQADYKNDFYAAAVMNEKIREVEPVDLLVDKDSDVELSNAEFVEKQYNGKKGVRCVGNLHRESGSEISIADYINTTEYIGAKITIDSIGKHNYLVVCGKKASDHGQPMICAFDENNEKISEIFISYPDIDDGWHQYVLDLSDAEGRVTIYLNGGYADNTGSRSSEYIFSDVMLY